MNYYNKLLTKKSLYNVPYRMLLLNYKELSKKRTCFDKICFFKKVLPYLYTARIWLNLINQRHSEKVVNRCFTK